MQRQHEELAPVCLRPFGLWHHRERTPRQGAAGQSTLYSGASEALGSTSRPMLVAVRQPAALGRSLQLYAGCSRWEHADRGCGVRRASPCSSCAC